MISEKEYYRYVESWDCRNTHRYTYSYDGLGRFTYSDHYLNGSLVDENFETGFRYDRNGNLLALQRYGIAANPFTHDYLADDFSYAYDGNRLERITNRALPQDETMETEDDPGTEYSFSYDSNGRITHDDHQGLDISYSVLNFPCRFYDIDSMTETSYIYLSDGIKHSVSMHDGLGKLYRGSFVYDSGSASLESVATPEGRLAVTTAGILDLWYAKDYLGNVRSVIDLASGVIEENDYLPFGTRIQDDNQPVMSDNRWRYANKEEQSSLVGGSCTLIDFGARSYDPVTCIFMQIDPMAEKYYGMTPYYYCAGNPVMMVDDDGRKPRVYIETKRFGHAFLTTDEGRNLTIYTMGRTGNIPRLIKKIGLSGVSPVGEGVLSVLRGEDAKKYRSDRTSNGIHYSIFEFDGDDSKVDEHFQSLFNNGTKNIQ